MVDGKVTVNENGTLRFEAVCMCCGKPVAVDQLNAKQFEAWQAGALAQNAFPGMSDAEREVLVSGSHAKCFADMFPPEPEEEEPEDGDDEEAEEDYFEVTPKDWTADPDE